MTATGDIMVTAQMNYSRYSIKRQKAIDRLLLLFNQGIPVIFTDADKADMVLRYNLLMLRALGGYFNLYSCKDMKEYELEALRANRVLRKEAWRVQGGARVMRRLKPLPPLHDCNYATNDNPPEKRVAGITAATERIRSELAELSPAEQLEVLNQLAKEMM